MAELAIRARSAAHGIELPARDGRARLSEAGLLSRYVYRGPSAGLDAVAGVRLPTTPCRAAGDGALSALWLGPDEWLLLGDASAPSIAILRSALGGIAASLVDVSDRNAGIVVEGPRAGEVLSAGCPLDLDLTAFPVGICTRTIFAKAEIVLWRTGPDRFHVEVWRSFAPYVVGLLSVAMRDLD